MILFHFSSHNCVFLYCPSVLELLNSLMAVCENASQRFPVPASEADEPHCTELREKRSRFLAQTCHCQTGRDARDFVESIRLRHPDATHNCWAYVAGPPADTSRIGSSDDGEPHGTAGKPMLNALLHCGIGQICVVVSRWFGGIKLGTGGLARAYQDSVTQNLQSLPLKEYMPTTILNLKFAYGLLRGMKRLFSKYGAIALREDYQTDVSIRIMLPLDQLDAFCGEALNAGNGEVTIEKCRE